MRWAASLGTFAAIVVLIVVADRPSGAAPAPGPFPSPIPSSSAQPQTNPFPSPSPTPRTPLGNGYIAAGYLWGSAGHGLIQAPPLIGATPKPFPGSVNDSGFWLDIAGRLGPSYLAALSYENSKIFGGDHPYLSYAQLSTLYQPPATRLGFGLGYINVQRSTASANMNSFGPGIVLLPNLSTQLSMYGSFFFYPRLQTNGSSSSLFADQLGLVFTPRPSGGLFVRFGIAAHCCLPAATSPKTDFSTRIGLGTSF